MESVVILKSQGNESVPSAFIALCGLSATVELCKPPQCCANAIQDEDRAAARKRGAYMKACIGILFPFP